MEITYKCEYAKTGRSACKACKKPLPENAMRVGKSSPSPFFDGVMLVWYHPTCFEKKFGKNVNSVTQIIGHDLMRPEDQALLRKMFGGGEADAAASGTATDAPAAASTAGDSTAAYWQLKDQVSKQLTQKEAKLLLERNQLPITGSLPVLTDRLVEALFYGVPQCGVCSQRDLVFREGRYNCQAETEWGRCGFEGLSGVTVTPFTGQDSSSIAAIRSWNRPPQSRPVVATVRRAIAEYARDPRQPLKGMSFTCAGWIERSKEQLKDLVVKNGGNFVEPADLNGDVDYVLTTFGDIVRQTNVNIKKALQLRLALVSETLLDRLLEEFGFSQVPYLLAGQLPPIGLAKLAPPANAPAPADAKLDSGPGKSDAAGGASGGAAAEETTKLGVVDKDAGFPSGKIHVMPAADGEDAPTLMDVMLTAVDVSTGINKYYRMQVIDTDSTGKRFSAFFKWGRIGGSAGASTKTSAGSLNSAVAAFEEKFLDKTGNEWKDRKKFVKKAGKYLILEMEADDQNSVSAPKKAEEDADLIPSYLDPRVQDLIKLIFDVDMLTKQMMSLQIDVRKMPLGKISKQMVQRGYDVLRQIETTLQSTDPKKQVQLMNLSNQFYTVVPHDFGKNKPVIIDSFEILKLKQQQLEALMDISIASQLLSSADEELTRTHPLDRNYNKLGLDLKPMNKFSREWKTVQKYISNGHNPQTLHNTLTLVDAYHVVRPGETEKFKPFESTKRKLLWHGSRLCNYVGILNQGLRIAPKEAPMTGYLFGKGLYFADLIEKSAPFCHPGDDKMGLLLLCDVAVGDSYEITKPEYVEKLPTGKLSTLAWGKLIPDPAKDENLGSEPITVPLGPQIPSGKDEVFLAQSEYVVYNIDQVRIKYIVKIKFD
eukprot:TRINITY_DN503_c0_g1_i1.p1 TRINITY_DN503_c0_g1~~TRINITY_DN503_c0_g1_i1.p1  ORF type:complete len:911 (+),score=243.47 TRINITY_DN503_c0_g1_i1:100-2733(+)